MKTEINSFKGTQHCFIIAQDRGKMSTVKKKIYKTVLLFTSFKQQFKASLE